MVRFPKLLTSLCVISICFTFFIVGCKKAETTGHLQHIIAPKVEKWVRYEKLLNEIDTVNGQGQLNQLFNKYAIFSDLFFYKIINDVYAPDTSKWNLLLNYRDNRLLKELNQVVSKKFGDLSGFEQDYANGFERLRSLKFDVPTPEVYTCISEMSTAAFVVSDSILGISLDMYLGAKSPYYDVQTWPMYIQRFMNTDNIVPNLLKSYIRFSILPQREPRSFLDFALDQGKEVYLLTQILDAGKDTLCFDYSKAQLDFCEQSEKEIWAYLLDQKLIYSNDFRKFQKYVEASPHATGMPEGAPGRIAAYVGYKIIMSYIKRKPEASLVELMSNTDSQKILETAKYKP